MSLFYQVLHWVNQISVSFHFKFPVFQFLAKSWIGRAIWPSICVYTTYPNWQAQSSSTSVSAWIRGHTVTCYWIFSVSILSSKLIDSTKPFILDCDRTWSVLLCTCTTWRLTSRKSWILLSLIFYLLSNYLDIFRSICATSACLFFAFFCWTCWLHQSTLFTYKLEFYNLHKKLHGSVTLTALWIRLTLAFLSRRRKSIAVICGIWNLDAISTLLNA